MSAKPGGVYSGACYSGNHEYCPQSRIHQYCDCECQCHEEAR